MRVSENCLKGPRIIIAPCSVHLLLNQEKTQRSGPLNSHLVQQLISWTLYGANCCVLSAELDAHNLSFYWAADCALTTAAQEVNCNCMLQWLRGRRLQQVQWVRGYAHTVRNASPLAGSHRCSWSFDFRRRGLGGSLSKCL